MSLKQHQILEHYRSEAIKHRLEGTSTIQDIRTRRLEIEAIFSYVRDGMRILEVGCGNGYTAQALVERFAVELDAIDLSADLIALAKERRIENARGKVTFALADIMTLDGTGRYELIFTERCLQNLTSWNDQKIALGNIARALRPAGEFVMLESFHTGQDQLNAARKELDLPPVEPSWYNLWFDEQATVDYMAGIGCEYVDQNRFLSGYYFGSRVLLPAMMPRGKSVSSQSVLNDYFCHLPPYGDFCPMKIVRFRKR